MVRLSLDWINWLGGLTSHQIVSVIVVAVIFTIASGLVLMALTIFGVRSGLMAASYTSKVPKASDAELLAYLVASAFGTISVLLMVFLGFAENDLDNPMFFPLSLGPILIGGVFLLAGVGLGFRAVRGRRVARAA